MTYIEYFRSKALKFFTNAAVVGNYLTGITVSVKAHGKLSLTLTDDYRYIKHLVNSRKSLKLKFVRQSSNDIEDNIIIPKVHNKIDPDIETSINKSSN